MPNQGSFQRSGSATVLNFLFNFLFKGLVLLNGKSSEWKRISAGVPQGSVLGPLFFLVYINDIVKNINSEIKLFADDTSLFSVVESSIRSANDLNSDLEKVRLWAWQWKMKFNTDKTEEVIFSSKRTRLQHPVLMLGPDEVTNKSEHKHLGMILDSKLSFQSHVKEAIVKARRGIGMIRYLSKYVSRYVLDQIYKLYVRPHLDYGDIIYHRPDPEMKLDITKRLEQTQYAAALAVTGAWRGTNRRRLYGELGWESLYQRRWYRRLCHFFNLRKTQAPIYLFDEIPPERPVAYNLRHQREYEPMAARTVRFSNTYFQNVLSEWHSLENNIKESETISEFKRKLLAVIRPKQRSVYSVYDRVGIKNLTKLRLQFSPLNEHRFRHHFDCFSPRCLCGMGEEDNEHFLLHCPQFGLERMDLFRQLAEVPDLDITDMDSKNLCDLLLYGSDNLNISTNRMIIEATISFIEKTRRFG